MFKNLIILSVVVGLTTTCTNPTYELTGVVQDGVNGEAIAGVEVVLKGSRLSVKTDDTGEFTLKVPDAAASHAISEKGHPASAMVLVTDKNGYQPLEYKVSSRMSGMTLNILPEPLAFQASDYTCDFIPFTTRMTQDVKWEDIIDGIRLFY